MRLLLHFKAQSILNNLAEAQIICFYISGAFYADFCDAVFCAYEPPFYGVCAFYHKA